MESQKYLVIITLIDGQNFTVPDGAPDKVEATVFAEARFGKESILRSDPIKLTNSNPEFVTELAWQLDKRNLHQLRVERKSIKLQVFMQTRERKKSSRQNNTNTNGWSNDSGDTHKVELIGYTILDIRSAQQKEQPKFQWLPLLNPKFRKSSYNRPEIQLAVTLSRIDDDVNQTDSNQHPSISNLPNHEAGHVSFDSANNHNESLSSHDKESSNDTRLFTTCLETTTNSDQVQNDEIIDNDIIIRFKNGVHYVYDAKHPQKFTMEECHESYKIDISIPFGSGLHLLAREHYEKYYFSVKLFGMIFKTAYFRDLTFAGQPPGMVLDVRTTHSGALATYFELNPDLDIKLYSVTDELLGIATLQLNQLCSLDMKCRSIEGVFAVQSLSENEQDVSSAIHPSIGVSIILERECVFEKRTLTPLNDRTTMEKDHFGEDIDDYLLRSLHDTHQLTLDDTNIEQNKCEPNDESMNELIVEDHDGPGEDDHHFCFTIDLKKFSYTSNQRLIPTLRELVIRYSYPFFGYKDTITTDASIPINSNSSIIVSGFCEFNFATTSGPLLTALRELPLNLEILAFDDSRLKEFDNDSNERVATCDINLAEVLGLNDDNINQLRDQALSKTSSVPIFALNGEEIGQLQIYLCLKDLGRPSQKFKASVESLNEGFRGAKQSNTTSIDPDLPSDIRKVDAFISEMKKNFESWKDDYSNKLFEEMRRKDNERFKRLYQRVDAKETKRDQEFRRKIDDLNTLERKFKDSLACVEDLEKMLAESLEQMKIKNAILDTKLDMMDLKISQLISNNKNEQKQSKNPMPMQPQCSFDDYIVDNIISARVSPRNGSEKSSPRRSSLRNPSSAAGIPLPIRSSSLVRPSEGSSSMRIVKRATGVPATVINGINSRVRSNSARLNLMSKEIQEKLINLRKEKAELLKRGCKPSDELIQEINSLIEKLVC